MPTCVVFDCESDGLPPRGARGALDFTHVQCTVACAIVLDLTHGASGVTQQDLDQARRITCWRDVASEKGVSPFKALFEAFDEASLIVGFNSLDFDMPLLYKHYRKAQRRNYINHRLKSHDIFSRIRAVTGSWPSMNSLLNSAGLEAKSSDGAEAIKMWEEGRRVELEEYCMTDVLRTAQLSLVPELNMPAYEAPVPSHIYGLLPAWNAVFAALPPPPEVMDTDDSHDSSPEDGFVVVLG